MFRGKSVKKGAKFESRTRFGKEHYEVIAKALRTLPASSEKDAVVMALTRELSENSPSFIAHRFIDACVKE